MTINTYQTTKELQSYFDDLGTKHAAKDSDYIAYVNTLLEKVNEIQTKKKNLINNLLPTEFKAKHEKYFSESKSVLPILNGDTLDYTSFLTSEELQDQKLVDTLNELSEIDHDLKVNMTLLMQELPIEAVEEINTHDGLIEQVDSKQELVDVDIFCEKYIKPSEQKTLATIAGFPKEVYESHKELCNLLAGMDAYFTKGINNATDKDVNWIKKQLELKITEDLPAEIREQSIELQKHIKFHEAKRALLPYRKYVETLEASLAKDFEAELDGKEQIMFVEKCNYARTLRSIVDHHEQSAHRLSFNGQFLRPSLTPESQTPLESFIDNLKSELFLIQDQYLSLKSFKDEAMKKCQPSAEMSAEPKKLLIKAKDETETLKAKPLGIIGLDVKQSEKIKLENTKIQTYSLQKTCEAAAFTGLEQIIDDTMQEIKSYVLLKYKVELQVDGEDYSSRYVSGYSPDPPTKKDFLNNYFQDLASFKSNFLSRESTALPGTLVEDWKRLNSDYHESVRFVHESSSRFHFRKSNAIKIFDSVDEKLDKYNPLAEKVASTSFRFRM